MNEVILLEIKNKGFDLVTIRIENLESCWIQKVVHNADTANKTRIYSLKT